MGLLFLLKRLFFVAGATLFLRNAFERFFDVLTASGPGDFVALWAESWAAHYFLPPNSRAKKPGSFGSLACPWQRSDFGMPRIT